jgi:hypothetical protein
MAYNITTSIHGKRLGLNMVSTGVSGGTKPSEFLVGPDDFRRNVVTASTDANIPAYGVSLLSTSTTASSTNTIFTIDPPIVGVKKTLWWSSTNSATNAVILVTTGAVFHSSCSSSATKLGSSANFGGTIELIGLTTSMYGIISPLSSGQLNSTAST